MEATSFSERLRGDKADLVYLVKGNSEGRPAWFCVEVERPKLAAFKEAVKHNGFVVANYAKVLYSGFGAGPSNEVTTQLETDYNQ